MLHPATPTPAGETRGAPSRRILRSGTALPGSASIVGRSWIAPACREHPPAPSCWDRPPRTCFGSLYPSSRRFRYENVCRIPPLRRSLAVAGVATRNVLHGANVVLRLQHRPQRKLVGVRRAIGQLHGMELRRLLIVHVENLLPWTQELFRRAVTFQAPLHPHRRRLVHQ